MTESRSGPTIRVELWSAKPYWYLDDIVALISGVDPILVREHEGFSYSDEQLQLQRAASDALDFQFDGNLGSRQLKPLAAIEYFGRFGLEFPEALVKAIRNRADHEELPKTREETSAVSERHEITALKKRLATLQRLSLLLAIAGYSYDPKASRNPSINEIVSDGDLHGLPISKDTVRNHLAEAARELLHQYDHDG